MLRAQQPVNWQCSAKKIGEKIYEIHLTPTVQAPWHIYSQHSPAGGPEPTSFVFNKNPLAVLEGKTKETGKIVSKYEEVFDITVKYFEGKIDFVQVVRLKAGMKTAVSGTVTFMACNDEQCLPPVTLPFSIKLE